MIWRRSFCNEAVANAVIIFLMFLFIIALVSLGKLLAKNTGLPTASILLLLLLQVFKALPQLLSFSIFAGLAVAFGRMARTREYEAWSLAGLGLRSWNFAILILVVPIAVVTALLTVYAVPWSLRISSAFEQQLADDVRLSETVPGVFGQLSRFGLVYHIAAIDPGGVQLRDLLIAQQLDEGRMQIILAQRAQTDTPEEPLRSLEVGDGAIYAVDLAAATVNEFKFGRGSYEIGSAERDELEHRLRARKSADLAGGSDRAQVELLWRWAVPLSTLLLALFALPAGLSNPRSGREYKLFLALLGFWLYWAIEGLFKDLGLRGQLSPQLAAFAPPVMIAAALVLFLPFAKRLRR